MILFSGDFHPRISANSECRVSIVRDVILLVGDHSGRKVSLISDFRESTTVTVTRNVFLLDAVET